MPFKPFTKADAKSNATGDYGASPAAPMFSKKKSRKQRKAAPAQKQLMSGGRSMSGGGR